MPVPQRIRSDVGEGAFSLLFTNEKIRHMRKIKEIIDNAIAQYGTTSIYIPKEGKRKEHLSIPVPEGVNVDDLCDSINQVIKGKGLQIDDECLSTDIHIIWSWKIK